MRRPPRSSRRLPFGLAWLLICATAGGVLLAAQEEARESRRDARAAHPFEFLPPERQMVDRNVLIEWRDADGRDGIDNRLTSLTWYYTEDPRNLRSLRRISTYFADDFRRDLVGWDAAAGLGLDWMTVPDPDLGRGARVCRGGRNAPPLVSLDGWPGAVVISARLRPHVGGMEFGIAARVERRARGYFALRGSVELVNQLLDAPLRAEAVPQIAPLSWYWYELGVQENRRNTLLRARIYNGDRTRCLRTLVCRVANDDTNLPRGGLVALLGPADFAEVYVDPWSARWEDDRENRLLWNTEEVPNGRYYLVAELLEASGQPRRYVSPFPIIVQHDRGFS